MASSNRYATPTSSSENPCLSPNEAIRAAMDLHDLNIKTISLRGKDYFPFTKKKGCRSLSIGPFTFMTQNPEKNSETAALARKGHKLTWIFYGRHGGLIQDGVIIKKSSIIDPNLPDWEDHDALVTVKYEGSGPTKRAKLQEGGDGETAQSPKVDLPRSFSAPTETTLDTNSLPIGPSQTASDSKISEEKNTNFAIPILVSASASTVAVPAAVSNFVIPWNDLVIGNKLGSGAFGDVKRGQWRDTPVAVKFLHSSDAATAFFQEASLLCSLRHPNIVACLGVCAEEHHHAIVMELMSGNLTQLIQAGPIPLTSLLPLAVGITRGLCFLHQRSPKVIHRDIKPENILIDAGGAPKLGDFGVSKEALMTMTQTKIGTPSYAAPELLNSEAYGTAVDIYSLAMVIYSMATGVSPFASLASGAKPFTPLQIMMKVAINRERPLIPASVHPELSAIIRDCWEHFPKKRPTASQLLERLSELDKRMASSNPGSLSVNSSLSDSTIPFSATIPLAATVIIPPASPDISHTVVLDSPTISLEGDGKAPPDSTSTRATRSSTRAKNSKNSNLPTSSATESTNPFYKHGRVLRSARNSTSSAGHNGQTELLNSMSIGSTTQLLETTTTNSDASEGRKKGKRKQPAFPDAQDFEKDAEAAHRRSVYQLEIEEGSRRNWMQAHHGAD